MRPSQATSTASKLYRPGSKYHDIACRILLGEAYDKITSETGVKRRVIYNIRSQLNRVMRDLHELPDVISLHSSQGDPRRASPIGTPPSSFTSPHSLHLPHSPEGDEKLPGEESDMTNEEIIRAQPREHVLEVKGSPVDRRIQLTPKTLTMIDWFIGKYKYEGDVSDFLNDAVEDFFQSRRYFLKVVKDKIE